MLKPMMERTTEADVQELVNLQVAEHLQLEYKDSRAFGKSDREKNEISRDVSAMANSAGGTVIYGVAEEPKTIPCRIDDGTDPAEFSAEWLENVITSRIRPKIEGVIIRPVLLKSGRQIYLVHVPQGHTAHQAGDHVYYKRRNTKREPMEDYEVRDVMNRLKTPVLTPVFTFKPVKQNLVVVYVSLRNDGMVQANDYALELLFPGPHFVEVRGSGFIRDETSRTSQKVTVGRGYTIPIFRSDLINLRDHGLDLSYKILKSPEFGPGLRWRVFADDAEPREGREESPGLA